MGWGRALTQRTTATTVLSFLGLGVEIVVAEATSNPGGAICVGIGATGVSGSDSTVIGTIASIASTRAFLGHDVVINAVVAESGIGGTVGCLIVAVAGTIDGGTDSTSPGTVASHVLVEINIFTQTCHIFASADLIPTSTARVAESTGEGAVLCHDCGPGSLGTISLILGAIEWGS